MLKRLMVVLTFVAVFGLAPSAASAAPGPPSGRPGPPTGTGCEIGLRLALQYAGARAPQAVPYLTLALARCTGEQEPPVPIGDGGSCALGISTAIIAINTYAPAAAQAALPYLNMAMERCAGAPVPDEASGCEFGLDSALSFALPRLPAVARERVTAALEAAKARCP